MKVLTRVMCGACASESKRRQVGRLELDDDGKVWWSTTKPRPARRPATEKAIERASGMSAAAAAVRAFDPSTARRDREVRTLISDPRIRLRVVARDDAALPAHCQSHGDGGVSRPDVLGNRGTVVVSFMPARSARNRPW